MLSALFGSSASAAASATASASAEAEQVPDTRGLALGTPLVVVAAIPVGTAGFAYVRGVVRRP